jgi:hypothetical protein
MGWSNSDSHHVGRRWSSRWPEALTKDFTNSYIAVDLMTAASVRREASAWRSVTFA